MSFLRANFVVPLLIAVVAMAASSMLGRYGAYLVNAVAIASIGAMALNLLNGWCGQINFAQAALLGVGAYAAGTVGNAGGGGLLALAVAGVAAAIASILIGLPALRLRGLYFAIATLAAQFIFEYLFKFADPITHGVSGLLIRPMSLFGRTVESDQGYAALSIALLLLTWYFMVWIRRTDLGRAFLVVRENEIVARGMGLDVARTKMWAFLLSGFFAGIAGGLMGFTARLAHPETFGLSLSVDYIAMIIVGGLGSLGGSLLGAVFVTMLPELIQRVGEVLNMSDLLSAMREMAFGMLIILFLIFEPRGLSAIVDKLKPRSTSERRKKPVEKIKHELENKLEWRKVE